MEVKDVIVGLARHVSEEGAGERPARALLTVASKHLAAVADALGT